MAEVIVVVEDRSDAEIATKLAERVLVEVVDWLEPEQLPYCIQWRGFKENTPFSNWKTDVKNADKIATEAGLRMPKTRGHSAGSPLQPDGASARKAIILTQILQRKQPEIKAVLLIRDLDNQPMRRAGLEQARQEMPKDLPLQIILGMADPKREAWVLNGFIAQTQTEEQSLSEIQTKICFDPCEDAHKLRSLTTDSDQSRNIKKVLEQLTQNCYEREQKCWEDTPLDILRQRGSKTGLREYLAEVAEVSDKLLAII